MSVACVIYRCGKQPEMYLYARVGLNPDELPPALRKITGRLVQVMELKLDALRKLARVDTAEVMAQLDQQGYYLQMPPQGHLQAHLYEGD